MEDIALHELDLIISPIRLQEKMYGQRDAGFFGYSHFTGGYPGGQAEYVRVSEALLV